MAPKRKTAAPKQPAPEPKTVADIPLTKPSEFMKQQQEQQQQRRNAPGAKKPLIDLSKEDLRAAGVQFFDNVDVAGMTDGDWVRRTAGGWGDGSTGPKSGAKSGKPEAKPGAAASAPSGSRRATVEEISDGEDGESEVAGDDGDDEATDDEAERERAREARMEKFWDEFFDALMWTVPFSFLYLMLDVLTNLSYSRHPAFSHYMKNYIMSTPTIGIIVFYTTRHAESWWVRALMTAASIGSGTRLVWLVNKASYLTVLKQAPAMGTIWILTIVQLPLTLAVAALATVFGWLYQRGLKLVP